MSAFTDIENTVVYGLREKLERSMLCMHFDALFLGGVIFTLMS